MVDFDKRLRVLQQALEKLTEKAQQDGVITDQEANIIAKAKERISEYSQLLDSAKEDGIIDDEERTALSELEEMLYADTYFTSIDDGELDDDELLLLRTLILTVDPSASVSWLEDDR